MSIDIENLTFGNDDAELDEKRGFLDKVFLDTAIYNRVKSGQRELVVGRKGTGKSAICLMLKKALDNDGGFTIYLTPSALSQRKFQILQATTVSKDESYALAWKYAILVNIGQQLLDYLGRNRNVGKQNPIFQSACQDIRSFLVSNGEIEGTIVEKAKKKVNSLSKVSLKVKDVETSLESTETSVENNISTEINKIFPVVERALNQLNKKWMILIDKVDDIWNSTSNANLFIVGLINAVRHLNSMLKNCHIIIFIRADIYDTLKFNDSDKSHSSEERLKWDEIDLKRLITMRARVSAAINSNDQDKIWDMVFDEKIGNEKSFHYIIDRTMLRPREAIQFCNAALGEAQDRKHGYILENDVLEAEKQYSQWKLKDVVSEYIVQYSYLEELLGLFQGFKIRFTYQEFDARYRETQIKLQSKYPEIAFVDTNKILQILYIAGFLGVKSKKQEFYVWDDPTFVLAQSDLIEQVFVHPAFHYALGLKQIIIKQKGSKTTIKKGSKDNKHKEDIVVEIGDINNSSINIAGSDIIRGDKVIISENSETNLRAQRVAVFERDLQDITEQFERIRFGSKQSNTRLGRDSLYSLIDRIQDYQSRLKGVEMLFNREISISESDKSELNDKDRARFYYLKNKLQLLYKESNYIINELKSVQSDTDKLLDIDIEIEKRKRELITQINNYRKEADDILLTIKNKRIMAKGSKADIDDDEWIGKRRKLLNERYRNALARIANINSLEEVESVQLWLEKECNNWLGLSAE